ncbi:hypothetical protein ACU639_01455 [Streptomyces cynarae]|uniref:hypothetical protein n=1 Tax=Streptomyces cynarae TaxID=2981134 RepID=UPI00406CEF7D
MAPVSDADCPQPDTVRGTLHDCRAWWSNRATSLQKIAAVAAVIACTAMTGLALAHSLGLFVTRSTVGWAHGTYTVSQCTRSGIASMKIDNATSAQVTAEVHVPGTVPTLGKLPLYPGEHSGNPSATVTVPANGGVMVYLKLGAQSKECAYDATDDLNVVSVSPAN